MLTHIAIELHRTGGTWLVSIRKHHDWEEKPRTQEANIQIKTKDLPGWLQKQLAGGGGVHCEPEEAQ